MTYAASLQNASAFSEVGYVQVVTGIRQGRAMESKLTYMTMHKEYSITCVSAHGEPLV